MVVIDFETVDPFIGAGYGAGWVFALKNFSIGEDRFRLLGASVKINNGPTQYITDLEQLAKIITNNQVFIMHNAMYDIGCILHLLQIVGHDYRTWLKNSTFYDTMLMAKLVNQGLLSYSLDNLSKLYGGQEKSKDTLTTFVWESGLYSQWYKEEHDIVKRTRPNENLLFNYAITNLDKLPLEIVADYCNHDVSATSDLFHVLKAKLDAFTAPFNLQDYSTLLKINIASKVRGVRIDLERAKETKTKLLAAADDLLSDIYKEVGQEFNINAPAQVVDALKKVGMTNFPLTDKGNESVKKDWLEDQGHPICQKIVKVKNYQKLARDFLTKIIDSQNLQIQNNSDDYRIFPNINILGATSTGRFSSSGSKKGSFELNIQQIPKRGDDDDAAKYVREIFIAEKEETWLSADYSNQEQRLQVEYAHRLGLNSSSELLRKMQQDPNIDFHQTVANICGIERTPAKTISLGLSYGMGEAKLCHSLNLPTKWIKNRHGRMVEVAGTQAAIILARYHRFMPFMKELQEVTKNSLKTNGYIKTLGGRRLYDEKPILHNGSWISFERKGLSKLIQGSAADVTMRAMINCYNAGLHILFPVHDELNISSSHPEQDKELLRLCMEHTYNLAVPMPIEITQGISWAG